MEIGSFQFWLLDESAACHPKQCLGHIGYARPDADDFGALNDFAAAVVPVWLYISQALGSRTPRTVSVFRSISTKSMNWLKCLPFNGVMIALTILQENAQCRIVPSLITRITTILVLRRGIRSEIRILRYQTKQMCQKEHVDENGKLTWSKQFVVAI